MTICIQFRPTFDKGTACTLAIEHDGQEIAQALKTGQVTTLGYKCVNPNRMEIHKFESTESIVILRVLGSKDIPLHRRYICHGYNIQSICTLPGSRVEACIVVK